MFLFFASYWSLLNFLECPSWFFLLKCQHLCITYTDKALFLSIFHVDQTAQCQYRVSSLLYIINFIVIGPQFPVFYFCWSVTFIQVDQTSQSKDFLGPLSAAHYFCWLDTFFWLISQCRNFNPFVHTGNNFWLGFWWKLVYNLFHGKRLIWFKEWFIFTANTAKKPYSLKSTRIHFFGRSACMYL